MLDCTRGQGSAAERPEELARPHLHEFLAACYEHYDIVIWSATSMKWIEVCGACWLLTLLFSDSPPSDIQG